MNSGIEAIDDSIESEVAEPTVLNDDDSIESEVAEPEPELKTTKQYAIEKLTAKMDEGFDLSDKAEKSRICHEIANEISNITGSCSYQAVAKEVSKVLKAKKEIKTEPETVIVDGNSIKKKGAKSLKRPDRKIIDETIDDENNPDVVAQKVKELLALQNSSTEDSFESMSIEFALEDVSFLISALGLPKPQTKMLKQRAKQIASYNNLQRAKGNHEQVIEVSDKILKYAIYLGLFSTFAQPIIKRYFPKDSKSKKSGIEVKQESLRD